MLHSCRVFAFSDVYNQFLMFFIIKYVGFNITRVVFYDVLHHFAALLCLLSHTFEVHMHCGIMKL